MTKLLVVSYSGARKGEADGKGREQQIIEVRRASEAMTAQGEKVDSTNSNGSKEIKRTVAESTLKSKNPTEAEHLTDDEEDQGESTDKLTGGSTSGPGRVRSTMQMTNFIMAQAERFNLFDPPRRKQEKEVVRQNWEQARTDFNQKFGTDVDLVAYKRKISHAKKSVLTEGRDGDARGRFSTKLNRNRSDSSKRGKLLDAITKNEDNFEDSDGEATMDEDEEDEEDEEE